MPEFLRYNIMSKSVQYITLRQEYRSVYKDALYIFEEDCLNLLINSTQAWVVNFNNGNDNWNGKARIVV